MKSSTLRIGGWVNLCAAIGHGLVCTQDAQSLVDLLTALGVCVEQVEQSAYVHLQAIQV
jgi:hypothetical protein